MFDKFILPPTAEFLSLEKYVLLLLLSLEVPYISMVTGCLFYSVIFNILHRKKSDNNYLQFSKDLIFLMPITPILVLLLIVIPFICEILIYSEILYSSNIKTPLFISFSAILIITGLLLLYKYKNTFSIRENRFLFHISTGIISLILFLTAYLIVILSAGILLDPLKWGAENLVFSFHSFFRYLAFVTGSLSMAGACILFFFVLPQDVSPEYKNLVNKIGVNKTIIFVILQALFILLFIITLPGASKTSDLVGPYALVLFLSYAICIMLYRNDLKFENTIFIAFIIMFFLSGVIDYITRETAIRDHTKKLIARDIELREKITGETFIQPEINGKSVFENVCSSCHSYKEKSDGPPLSTVLTKYKNKPEELKSFIRKPVKINPDYPPMPDPGLREEEIDGVVNYLMKDYLEENK